MQKPCLVNLDNLNFLLRIYWLRRVLFCVLIGFLSIVAIDAGPIYAQEAGITSPSTSAVVSGDVPIMGW